MALRPRTHTIASSVRCIGKPILLSREVKLIKGLGWSTIMTQSLGNVQAALSLQVSHIASVIKS